MTAEPDITVRMILESNRMQRLKRISEFAAGGMGDEWAGFLSWIIITRDEAAVLAKALARQCVTDTANLDGWAWEYSGVVTVADTILPKSR